MEDTISRKKAIDSICRTVCDNPEICESPCDEVKILENMPSAQPETHDKRTKTHSCDCISRQAAIEINRSYHGQMPNEVNHRIWKEINELPSAQPEHTNSWCINSWCNNCKEYDTENKCCPRYNRVIKQTLDDAYRHGETEAEARFHAQQRWIPCSERLPEERQEILATTTDNAWGDVVIIRTYYKEMHKSVIAWMPLPEAYREGE